MLVRFDQNPKISDTVLIEFTTYDEDGNPINPYKVSEVIIYFIERSHTVTSDKIIRMEAGQSSFVNFYQAAIPISPFGDNTTPAWLSTDTSNAFLTKVDFDEEGNPLVGVFQLQWVPKFAKEGDYLVCYSWQTVPAAKLISSSLMFILYGDTSVTTVIPTHYTKPRKYEILFDRYTPETYKLFLAANDLTPDVLLRTQLAFAKLFTNLEDLTNQIVDLIDANAVQEQILPYLARLFGMKLKSDDPTLWRRQIKRAVPLYKKKGTLSGLTEALSTAGITLNRFSQLWQVVSSTTWQDGFVVSSNTGPFIFTLSELAILENPLDSLNFELFLRLDGSDTYIPLILDYVSFENIDGITYMTWVGDTLSVNPISLQEGDVVRIIYKIAQPTDQALEDYIRTLPLADTRDETQITYPMKNWNVRLIEMEDPLFNAICPNRNPFYDPLVYGKIRTEFPYSENIYNMEEYNGSTRDSTNPCHIDKDFMDACSCCVGSKFNADVEIDNLNPDRIQEASDIITDFVPFDMIPNQINYIGALNEFLITPLEEIETLVYVQGEDHFIMTQFDFNRLIEDGSTDVNELKRNMLANANSILSTSGTGYNLYVTLFSPGIKFNTLGVDDQLTSDNLLEILSGTHAGEYEVQRDASNPYVVDIIQGSPDTISFPIDPSSFPFRLSNRLYSELGASIYQDDLYEFSDSSIIFPDVGTQPGWKIVVTSGPYVGTYNITDINTDNTIVIDGFPSTVNVSGLSYELQTNMSVLIYSSNIGAVAVTRLGRLEIDQVTQELRIIPGDYVLFSGTQYKIRKIDPRDMTSTDKLYLDNYTSGTIVGTANITIYRRLIDNGVGYLDIQGMKLTGTPPTVNNTLENNMFLENYAILIGLNYYKIVSINGSDMILEGPMLTWGIVGTPVSYSIIQFDKTSPITTQNGTEFFLLDRRGNDSIVINTETAMPMAFTLSLLNEINSGKSQLADAIFSEEDITVGVEWR